MKISQHQLKKIIKEEISKILKENVDLDPREIEEMAKQVEAIGDDPITKAMMAGLESDPEISAKIDQIVDELSGKEAIEEGEMTNPLSSAGRRPERSTRDPRRDPMGDHYRGEKVNVGAGDVGLSVFFATPAVMALLASNPTFASLLSSLPPAIGAGGVTMGGALILGLIAAKMAQKKGSQ